MTTPQGERGPFQKATTYKLPGTEGGLLGPKRVPRHLRKQHSPDNHKQHHSGCLHKQRGGDEIGPSVCPSVENPDLVYKQTGYSQSNLCQHENKVRSAQPSLNYRKECFHLYQRSDKGARDQRSSKLA